MTDPTAALRDLVVVLDAEMAGPAPEYDGIAKLAIAALRKVAVTDPAAALRTALAAIAESRQDVTTCTRPCMYPQHHSGDESGMEFAYRIRDIARVALASQADDPSVQADIARMFPERRHDWPTPQADDPSDVTARKFTRWFLMQDRGKQADFIRSVVKGPPGLNDLVPLRADDPSGPMRVVHSEFGALVIAPDDPSGQDEPHASQADDPKPERSQVTTLDPAAVADDPSGPDVA